MHDTLDELLAGAAPAISPLTPDAEAAIVAMVADAAMRALSLNELEICPWALREGVILRRLDHTNGADELAGQGSP